MIEINNLSVGYGNNKIFEKFNLKLPDNQFVAIIGANGTGKSTLLKTIIGFLPFQNGNIIINNKKLNDYNPQELAKIITYIPQENYIQYNFTVEEIITMGRFPFISIWNSYSQKDKDIVEKIIYELKLEPLRNKYINQLSGGEKQRTLIGRAMAQNSDYILLDESFANLDINHQIEILNHMKKIHKEQKKTIIIISHNLNLAVNYADRIVALKDGKAIADGSPEQVITKENLIKLFGIELNIITNPITQKPNVLYGN